MSSGRILQSFTIGSKTFRAENDVDGNHLAYIAGDGTFYSVPDVRAVMMLVGQGSTTETLNGVQNVPLEFGTMDTEISVQNTDPRILW